MKKCPRCEQNTLDPIEVKNALSRRDNKTYICSDCGIDEAVEDEMKAKFFRLKTDFFRTFKTNYIKG